MEPPIELFDSMNTRLETLRAVVEVDPSVVDQLSIEVMLCGRIWSSNEKEALDDPILCDRKGALNSELRTCLAFHEIEILDTQDWKCFRSFIRNEFLCERMFRRPDQPQIEILREIGLTDQERRTLLTLDIPERTIGKFRPYIEENNYFENRKLFHLSLDGIQGVIRNNTQANNAPSKYYSLKIAEIFDTAVNSLITEPLEDGNSYPENETHGVLYSICEHALISAPSSCEPTDFLDTFQNRLLNHASGEYIDISNLRIRLSNALKCLDTEQTLMDEVTVGEQEIPEIDEHQHEVRINELHMKENRQILGWGGNLADEPQNNHAYIDAIQLTQQIWGETGDRPPIEGFARSMRITPYIDIVSGNVIRAFGNSYKSLHGGDDLLLSFDVFTAGRDDLVVALTQDNLDALLGTGRWYGENKDGRTSWHVIGTGFARPFWWWSIGDNRNEQTDFDHAFMERLKGGKNARRSWLASSSRVEIQIHLTDDEDGEEE